MEFYEYYDNTIKQNVKCPYGDVEKSFARCGNIRWCISNDWCESRDIHHVKTETNVCDSRIPDIEQCELDMGMCCSQTVWITDLEHPNKIQRELEKQDCTIQQSPRHKVNPSCDLVFIFDMQYDFTFFNTEDGKSYKATADGADIHVAVPYNADPRILPSRNGGNGGNGGGSTVTSNSPINDRCAENEIWNYITGQCIYEPEAEYCKQFPNECVLPEPSEEEICLARGNGHPGGIVDKCVTSRSQSGLSPYECRHPSLELCDVGDTFWGQKIDNKFIMPNFNGICLYTFRGNFGNTLIAPCEPR